MPCHDRTDEFRTFLRSHLTVAGDVTSTQAAIMPNVAITSDFMKAAQHIRHGIHEMKEFLEANKKEYLNVHRYLASSASTMSDADRDSLDAEVRDYVVRTKSSIETLKNRITEEEKREKEMKEEKEEEKDGKEEQASPGDHRAHQHSIILALFDELKDVTTIMQTMAAVRTAQMKEHAERLHPKSYHVTANIFTDEKKNAALVEALQEEKSRVEKPNVSLTLSEQEQAMFEEEHDTLLNELVDNIDQIKKAEQTTAAIGAMVTEFATKVLEQEDSINTIHRINEDATGHIVGANQELKKWMARSVEFRIMILFTLLMASFSLLFIDWYYS